MHVWPKVYGFNPYRFWEIGLNSKLEKRLRRQWTIKSRSRLNDYDWPLLIYMHGPSFMASKLEKKLRSQWTVKSRSRLNDYDWPFLFKMYAWPKFHGSSPYSFWDNNLNTKTPRKLPKSMNRKKLVKTVDLWLSYVCFSRCLHDRSFMALAHIVSEKMT